MGLASGSFVGVDCAPATPGDQPRHAGGERVGDGVGGLVQPIGVPVFEDSGDGVGCVLLVGTDHARLIEPTALEAAVAAACVAQRIVSRRTWQQ